MTKRTTETIHIYANGQIIGSYLIPKPPKDVKRLSPEEVAKCYFQVYWFTHEIQFGGLWRIAYAEQQQYKGEEGNYYLTKQGKSLFFLRYFYYGLPLNDIANVAYYTDYTPSKVLEKKIKEYEDIMGSIITVICWRHVYDNNIYNRYIIKYNKNLCELIGWITYHVTNNTTITDILTLHKQVIKVYYPVLKLAHTLYFMILFRKYIGFILFRKKHHISFTSYSFIRRNFGLKNMRIECFDELIDHLKNLQYYKMYGAYVLSIKQKKDLYEFIISLKTYYKMVNKHNVEFNYDGTLPNRKDNELLPIYHDRISKKYFPKFFGKNASYMEYKLEKKIGELESMTKYQTKELDEKQKDDLWEQFRIKLKRNMEDLSPQIIPKDDFLLSNRIEQHPFTEENVFADYHKSQIEDMPLNENSLDDSNVTNSSVENLNLNSSDDQENDDNDETND